MTLGYAKWCAMKKRLMIKTSTAIAIATATANPIPMHLVVHVGYRTLPSGNIRVLNGAGAMYLNGTSHNMLGDSPTYCTRPVQGVFESKIHNIAVSTRNA
jgi:hypothetical protein